MQPTATHDDRFVRRSIRAAVIVLLLTLSAVGSARAQRQMTVADRPEPQRPPGVVYVGGSSPTTPLRGTFFDLRPAAEDQAYAARFANLTYEPTEPLELVDGGSNLQPMAVAPEAGWSVAPAAARANAPLISFETQDFDDNITTTGGSIFIPPDPHGAVGPSDVVVVSNVSLASYDKATGVASGLALQSLKTFFGATTFTFDPKVVYDPFDNRFVVVTLEKEDMADGATANASRILLAASPVGTPSGTWTALSIDALLTIDSQDSWCDYPGLAVDEEAVYITCNYFTFGGSPSNTGQRLWTVDKAKYYAGTIIGSDIFVYDPATATGLYDVTMMPAQVHSNPGGSIGTWLVGYSGLSDGGVESYQVIRVDNPLGGGSASFTGTFVSLGDVDDTGTGFSDAPQSGTATRVETNDRRLLDAVWHDNGTEQRLWGVTTMIPPSGSDAGHETVFFAGIDTGDADRRR
ncbi:MAG: hypothetical protein KatS3mg044_0238 [Rhodothermaceae bacterium]|nr:MAG: hypothetical protein KatS3mg044_0238 [Rhodothermaceae bacterium]